MTTGATRGEDSQPADDCANQLDQPAKPTILCLITFTALGLLLLAAAGFKSYEAYSQPMATLRLVGALAVICFECCLGTWLVIGVRSKWTWRAVVMCFVAFACVSAYKVSTGASSCGCFGTLQVNPAITLAIDVAAVILLMLCRAGVEVATESKLRRVFPRVASFAMVLSLLATLALLYGQSRFVKSNNSITVAGDLVVLEPQSWLGAHWPLLGESGVPAELASGTWDVLLFRHDCHICHDVMLEIEPILSTPGQSHNIALIGIDKQSDDARVTRLRELGCLLGYLPQDREWFATTPLRVRLSDGECVSASVIEHWE